MLLSAEVIYQAAKDDPVDRRMAECVNSLPVRKRLAVLSLEREGDGVYRFGKKRAFVKCEKDHVIIRVGGGFLNFEEFVDTQQCKECH